MGFYRYFIPIFSALAAPLTDLTTKRQPNKIEWGESQERAYSALKHSVTSRPVLHLPDHVKPYALHVDASELGIGAVFNVMMENHFRLSMEASSSPMRSEIFGY